MLGGAGLGWQPGQVSLSTAAGAGTSPRGRDRSQGQRHPRQSQGVSVTFGRAVGAGQCHSVPGSCPGVL